VEIEKNISAKKICLALMEEGVLAKETHETVIRFAPPLIITKDEIDWAMTKIKKVFRDFS
jgi:ornithine--oxo-acid transaminase